MQKNTVHEGGGGEAVNFWDCLIFLQPTSIFNLLSLTVMKVKYIQYCKSYLQIFFKNKNWHLITGQLN